MPDPCYYCGSKDSVAVCIYKKGKCGKVLCEECCYPVNHGGGECIHHHTGDRSQKQKIKEYKGFDKSMAYNYFKRFGWENEF